MTDSRSLRVRFSLGGVGESVGSPLHSRLIDVIDPSNGHERTLRLWAKTGTDADTDLRALWRHEIRHVQRTMAYADSREVLVEALEFVEDDDYFGVVLARAGLPLTTLCRTARAEHWLRHLDRPEDRTILWRNLQRIARALGILHAQGLIHGNVGVDTITSLGGDDADFRLTGFEWSLWLGGVTHTTEMQVERRYSFHEDWQQLGSCASSLLGILPTGDAEPRRPSATLELTRGEVLLLRRMIAPGPTETVDASSIVSAIDDLLVRTASSPRLAPSTTLLLTFANWEHVADAIYDASDSEIALDDVVQQIAWLQADLDRGASLLVPSDFDTATSRLELVTENMHYELSAFVDRVDGARTWDIAICRKTQRRVIERYVGSRTERGLTTPIRVVQRHTDAADIRARQLVPIVNWSSLVRLPTTAPHTSEIVHVKRALLLIQTLEALIRCLENYPIEVVNVTQRGTVVVRSRQDRERDAIAARIGADPTNEALRRLFEDDERDARVTWRLSSWGGLGSRTDRDVRVDFLTRRADGALEFKAERDLPSGDHYYLRADSELGTEQVIRRRLRNISALQTRADLARALENPRRDLRSSAEPIPEDDPDIAELDAPKRTAMRAIYGTIPSFYVVGPPGVGKTHLATEVVKRRLRTEPAARVLVTSQGHDALSQLQTELHRMLKREHFEALVVRSHVANDRSSVEDDAARIGASVLGRLAASSLVAEAPVELAGRLREQRDRSAAASAGSRLAPTTDEFALWSLLCDAATVFLTTTNSQDIERLVEAREQFDWVLVEEAAKATGPELVGALQLSGRRLLIGDHRQLAPMGIEKTERILRSESLTRDAAVAAEPYVENLLPEGEDLRDLLECLGGSEAKQLCTRALRLLELFRSAVETDEAHATESSALRRVSTVLSEQRRMDPAIAHLVSTVFYDGGLKTETGRAKASVSEPLPYEILDGMTASPIVVVDHPHISAMQRPEPAERERRRWHNPEEVDSVIAVLRRVRPRANLPRPTLAVLSPYGSQVERLTTRLEKERRTRLAHLSGFAAPRSDMDIVGTVDSFQGSEADLVVMSLVRNNPRVGLGALGFLRDPRRMNVALSRAKKQLVIVGSLSFIDEAVRGVNPRGGVHPLSFLTSVVKLLRSMSGQLRENGVPLVTIIPASALRKSR